MKEKFAILNSIVGYITLEDNEFNQVKIVESSVTGSLDEVSKDSILGKTLMCSKEGDILTVPAEIPYKIKIINIVNSIYEPQKLQITHHNLPALLNNFILADTANFANYVSSMSLKVVSRSADIIVSSQETLAILTKQPISNSFRPFLIPVTC